MPQQGESPGSQTPSSRPVRVKKVGNYLIGKTLGQGTFGKVKLGTHVLTGGKAALKILEKDRIVDVADMQRITREIHILKLLNHPNVVRLFEVIDTPKHIYLIVENVSGGELFDYIVARKRVREKEACRFFHQIIAGLDYCHKRCVIHRDLKPENLLLDENKNIKIIDFGLSNMIKRGSYLKTACGSPCYAAPEMILGREYDGTAADLWSTGVLLFALVCGYLPFEDQNTKALYDKITHGRYKLPSFLSPECKDLIKCMLTVNPAKRITISKIREHPWWHLYNDAEDSRDGELDPEAPIDMDVVKQLTQFDFDPDYALRSLQGNKHNQVTATYYLLKEKLRREQDAREKAAGRGREADPSRTPVRKDKKISDLGAIGEDTEYDADSLAATTPATKSKDRSVPPATDPPKAKPSARRHSVAVGDPKVAELARKADAAKTGKEAPSPTGPPRTRRASMAVGAPPSNSERPFHPTDREVESYNGAFNVETTSGMTPKQILTEVKAVLKKNSVRMKQIKPYALKCEEPNTSIRFEVEVCKLGKFEQLYVLHFKRLTGDTWVYKNVCQNLAGMMRL
ncbi:Protein kinase domain [Carpediemonas membranifera]|uniref:non-specific serine/threonine protein kinase n=1 Tax=Carpediemonas membranifera TaxID=201153 RepID=A0A8J6DYU8_9EUKA|nr:Protein kinase domain [Carpediemonas membranifera]|eukprot:KAG9389828.1 Protein kinase domain [Carpediemonas membranifera]